MAAQVIPANDDKAVSLAHIREWRAFIDELERRVEAGDYWAAPEVYRYFKDSVEESSDHFDSLAAGLANELSPLVVLERG